MNADTLLENFEILADAPGGIDRLREVILGLAAQGKLFRDTDLTKWQLEVTLKDFGRMIRGITYAKAESSKEPTPNFVPLLGAANIQRSINYEGLTFVASSLIKPDQYLRDGDVLICMSSGSKHLVGKTGIVRNPPASSFGAFCGVFRISDEKNRDYLAMFFKSPMYRTAISVASRGIGINNLRVGDIESIALSLPPVAEQKRIVAKVDELMALCDQLEQQQKQRDNLRTATRKSAIDAISTATTPEELETAWKRINNNWDVIADTPESVGLLRELILDLAIRGKIVPQISSSNSVASLIQEMAHQKRRDEIAMSRQGKGSEFTRKNTLHNLPLSWHKGFLGDIALIVMGNSPPGDSYRDNEEGVPLINGPVEFSKPQLGPTIRAKFTVAPTYMCKVNDLLVCVRGATTGRTNIAAFDACIGRGVALVRGWQSQKFINLFMWNIGAELLSKGKGTTFPSISFDDLAGLEIGLPPIEEQELIIQRVDELMALCDQLESELNSRSEVAEKFARSVVSAA
jgi:type I restriction enzyme S subunit